jgi:hypothetical protein
MNYVSASPRETHSGALRTLRPEARQTVHLYGGQAVLDVYNRPRDGMQRRRYALRDKNVELPSVSGILDLLSTPVARDACAAGIAAGVIEERAGIFAEHAGEDGRTIGSIDVGRFTDLINEAPQAPARARRYAGILSARMHEITARIISGKPADLQHAGYRLTNAVEALNAWLKARQPVPLAVSRVVMSQRHRFAGTASLIARIGGVTTLVSFKLGCSNGARDRLQSAAYGLAFEEETGAEFARHAIVRLGESGGKFSEELFEPAPEPQTAFLCLREFYSVFKVLAAD